MGLLSRGPKRQPQSREKRTPGPLSDLYVPITSVQLRRLRDHGFDPCARELRNTLLAMHDRSYPLSVPIETAANDALQFALLEDYCKVMDDAVLTALTSVTSDFDAAEYNSNMYRKFCRTILALRVSASLARIVELKRVGEGSTLGLGARRAVEDSMVVFRPRFLRRLAARESHGGDHASTHAEKGEVNGTLPRTRRDRATGRAHSFFSATWRSGI